MERVCHANTLGAYEAKDISGFWKTGKARK